jgi:hypothetical protein
VVVQYHLLETIALLLLNMASQGDLLVLYGVLQLENLTVEIVIAESEISNLVS